jgi:hypothetical protein
LISREKGKALCLLGQKGKQKRQAVWVAGAAWGVLLSWDVPWSIAWDVGWDVLWSWDVELRYICARVQGL